MMVSTSKDIIEETVKKRPDDLMDGNRSMDGLKVGEIGGAIASTSTPVLSDQRLKLIIADLIPSEPDLAEFGTEASNCTRKIAKDLVILIELLKANQVVDGSIKKHHLDHLTFGDDKGPWLAKLRPWELEVPVSSSSSGKLIICKESGVHYTRFLEDLRPLRRIADGASSIAEGFDRHMAIGRVLYKNHLFNEALPSFKHGCLLQPTNPTPYLGAGNCLYVLGRYGEAVEEFSSALQAAESGGTRRWDFLLPQLRINLGSSLEGKGKLSSAVEHYRAATFLDPMNSRAFKLLGSALRGFGDYSAAEEALGKAISLNPDWADAWCELGLVLLAKGLNERAIQKFLKAIELKPAHVNSMYHLGTLFMDMGKHQKALEMYTQVLAIWPNNWRVQFNRAVVLSLARQDQEAIKAIQEASETSQKIKSHDEVIAHIKQLQGKMAKASGGRAVDEQIKAVLDMTLKSHMKIMNNQKGLFRTQAFKINCDEVEEPVVDKTAKKKKDADPEETSKIFDEVLPVPACHGETVNKAEPEPKPKPNAERVLTRGSRRMRAKQ